MTLNIPKLRQLGIRIVGDEKFRGACPKEDAELVTLIGEWKRDPYLQRVPVIHIPNEKKRRDRKDFAELKEQKMKGAFVPGASDIIAIGYPTLVIELKRQDPTQSATTQDQIDFMLASQAAGAWVFVALGYAAALRIARAWYKINLSKGLHIP